MAFLSFLDIGIPASGRLVFRPIYPQEIVPSEDVVKTGVGGIQPGENRYGIKPTGLDGYRPKAGRKDVEDRVEEARELHAEIAGKLARELRGEIDQAEQAIATMTMAEVDREIGVLLRKVQRTQDEEVLLLMLMAIA